AAALSLDRAYHPSGQKAAGGYPDQANRWLDWLLSYLAEEAQRAERTNEQVASLKIGIPLALALADGQFERFQTMVRTALRHPFTQNEDQITRSLPLLDRFPALRAPLARLFPQQPRRCTELLVR